MHNLVIRYEYKHTYAKFVVNLWFSEFFFFINLINQSKINIYSFFHSYFLRIFNKYKYIKLPNSLHLH